MEQSRLRIATLVAVLALSTSAVSWAEPVGTAFTYQGRLIEGGLPADGDYDFQFALYPVPVSGLPVGPIIELQNEAVTNGLFTDPPGRQWLDFVHGCNELVTVVEGRLVMRIGDHQWEIVTTTNGVIQNRASGNYSNSSVPKIAPG